MAKAGDPVQEDLREDDAATVDDHLKLAEATGMLARLNREAKAMGEHLLELKQALADAQRDIDGSRGAQLLEANGQLVRALLRAETIAENAIHNLDQQDADAAAQAQRQFESAEHTTALPPMRVRDLREANAQLLLSALAAQAHEADAMEAHRRQIEHMATVAHELRNPLTPIRLAVSLLSNCRPAETPTVPQLQGIIERQVEHLSRLVEDLLEGSRLSTGKLRLQRSTIDLIQVVEMAVQASRLGMETRQQSLILQLPPGPLEMQGDPIRLAQVFCNLLDNASKYTPKAGEITLAGKVLESSIELSVTDSGMGISAEGMPRIFDLFAQDDHALTLDNCGLGIGLAVVRQLVDAHGGTVFASSAGKDHGSRFVVTLPMGARPALR